MAVLIGSARISEHGTIDGQKGDQYNGREVETQNWYNRTDGKNWVLIRPNDANDREKIAHAMELACATDLIGYSQYTRNTLYNAVKPYGFDISKLTVPVNTDCSGLVRVCCAYAGIMLPDYNTSTEVETMRKTGHFTIYTDAEHCKSSNLLLRGDILVTSTKGHTVVVLSDGAKAHDKPLVLGERNLYNGCSGDDVAQLQQRLNDLGFDCGTVDGDFGKNTEKGLRAFQQANHITVDGRFNQDVFSYILEAERKKNSKARTIRIVNCKSCNIREIPNTLGKVLGYAKPPEEYKEASRPKEYAKEKWNCIVLADGSCGWVSDKYSEIIS